LSRERWVRRMWRGEAGVAGALISWLLLPVSAAFRGVLALRELGYGLGLLDTHEAALPVVSVGNLSVGGTGKTPVSRWVVEQLQRQGRRPAVVLRGYGRDEVELHERWAAGVPVVAASDRVAGVAGAAAEGADVAVLDDAFQHRRIERDLDIVLLAAEEPFPGPVLPRGAYREPAGRLERADVVVITRKRADSGRAAEVESAIRRLGLERPVARIHLRPSGLRTLRSWGEAGAETAEEARTDGPIRVASGVGDPDSVVAAVRALGLEVSDRADFPDHHDFTKADLDRIRGGGHTLVVTEKDAIKLHALAPDAEDILVLEQEVVVEQGEDLLVELLTRLPAPASRTLGGDA